MAVDVVRLISVLAILAFFLATSNEYHITREYKVINLMLWIMHAVLTVLDLMVSPTSVWYITVLCLIFNVWVIYRYVIELWVNNSNTDAENKDKSEK